MLIDKEKFLDDLMNCSETLGRKSLMVMLEILKNQPTIEAEPVVHGRWIMRGGKRYCSVCQARAGVTRDTDDFWYTVGTTYCPNCGAKMDGAKT